MTKTPVSLLSAAVTLAIAIGAASGTARADAGESPATAPATSPFLMADRYQQASAEVAALQHQAYNIATQRLDALLQSRQSDQKPAIVIDLDETVLDNSPYQAAATLQGFSFPAHWNQWIEAAEAPLIPGAGAFLHHANEAGVTIFYVSNRDAAQQAATIRNLRRDGLPQVSKNSVRLQGPPKTVRRAAIAKHYDILLLLGDTLHDFDGAYADTPLLAQREAVRRQAARFGNRYIVLPNATYGSWTHAPLSAWQPPAENASASGGSAATAPAGADKSSASKNGGGQNQSDNAGSGVNNAPKNSDPPPGGSFGHTGGSIKSDDKANKSGSANGTNSPNAQ